MRDRVTGELVVARRALVVAAIVLACTPALALAWSNGPDWGNGFGTHDWVLYQADRMAAAQGYDWLDFKEAQRFTDDPDMVIGDTVNHIYHVSGNHNGSSPSRVEELYSQTVEELRSGDRVAASRSFALLSHYYSDTCMPLHTAQTPAEEPVHQSLEDAQDRLLDSPDAQVDIVLPHELAPSTSPKQQTIDAAELANHDYMTLVDQYARYRYSDRVRLVCDRALNHSVDGLADLQAAVGRDAGSPRWARQSAPLRWAAPGTVRPEAVWLCGGTSLGILVLVALVGVFVYFRRR
jgi:hypothetical protein